MSAQRRRLDAQDPGFGSPGGLFVPKPNREAITLGQEPSWPAYVVRQRPQTCVHVRCDRYSVRYSPLGNHLSGLALAVTAARISRTASASLKSGRSAVRSCP
jgi:hypothetical protein